MTGPETRSPEPWLPAHHAVVAIPQRPIPTSRPRSANPGAKAPTATLSARGRSVVV